MMKRRLLLTFLNYSIILILFHKNKIHSKIKRPQNFVILISKNFIAIKMLNELKIITKKFLAEAKSFFDQQVPSRSLKDYHPFYSTLFGTLLNVVLLGAFLLILIGGYEVQIKEKYLSPSADADSDLCEQVAISRSGTYLLSTDGYWEGSSAFNYSSAFYQLDLLNSLYTEDYYPEILSYFRSEMDAIGTYATTQNLAQNLIFYMLYVIVDPDSQSN
jgi:hypothetical protein